MGIVNTLFGGIGNVIPDLVNMVSYPFGGGTAKADQAWVKAQEQQMHLPQVTTKPGNLYGNYTGIGPQPTYSTFNSAVVKPVAKGIVDAGSSVTSAVSSAASNALGSSQVLQLGVLAIAAIVVIKIIK